MSTPQLSAARRIWRARREHTSEHKAYTFYAILLVAVIVITPTLRALWVIAGSSTGVTVLTSPHAPGVVSTITAVLWAGGLLWGRKHGPALLPPFPLYAVTSSGIRRSAVLRRPLIRSAAIIIAVLAGSAVLVGSVTISHGEAELRDVTVFIAAAIATGIVTTLMWLVGQVFPHAAVPVGLSVLALAGASLLLPRFSVFAPWVWMGATYPSTGSATLALVGLAAAAGTLFAMTPTLLNRLTGMQLSAQAAQWERATTFSFSFDFPSATAVYQATPRVGRVIRAIVPHRHRWVTFIARDAVGQLRTPGRSVGAIVTTAFGAALMTLTFLPGAPSALLAGGAAILTYAASGPLSSGLQHAARVAGDYPLYGISDRHLVFLHAIFPLTVLLIILPVSAIATALVSGQTWGLAMLEACALGILTLALRLSSSLKGPLPPILLTPVSTPAGDVSVVLQLGWAFSDPLIAILGAIAITMLPLTPLPVILVTSWTAALILVRWMRRR